MVACIGAVRALVIAGQSRHSDSDRKQWQQIIDGLDPALGTPSATLVVHAARFGVGIYKVWLGEDRRAFVQQMLTSGVQTPDDADLDDMIGVVLDQILARDQTRYRQALK